MTRLFTFFIAILLCSSSMAQTSDFYFNVLQPSLVRTSHAPGDYSSVDGTTWGWDGMITNTIVGELAYAPADVNGDHLFCEGTADDFSGKFVLIDRGACQFSDKALFAQDQGAIGVIIASMDGSIVTMGAGTEGINVNIPIIMISLDDAAPLVAQLENNTYVEVELSVAPLDVAHVFGQVRFDENMDCDDDADEMGLDGWQVVMSDQNGNAKTAYTNEDGQYHTFSGLGTFDLTVIPPNNYWGVCNNNQSVNFTAYDTATVNFNAQVAIDCPQMTVDIETPFLRRCFNNNRYHVDYCNLGTEIGLDAYIQITFDPLITIISSSLPYTDLGNNLYQWDLGDVEVGTCDKFNIDFEVSCDSEFGQTLCAEAFIYPDTICEPSSATWTGSNLFINGSCDGNEVIFDVVNHGFGSMANASEYKVFKDGIQISNGSIQLDAGAHELITYSADGATYRVEAAQADDFPFETNPSRTIEACAPNGEEFSTGFFNQYPPTDYGHNHDEECEEVIGSFDPNDKQGFPKGYGDNHYIERGVDIEYLIRFQNTGSDTAFNIIVLDTISEHFDMTSIRLGVASHDYEFNVLDGNVLEFRFPDIMLADSNINEPASHGFLNFTISQKGNVPLETVINNSAAIYFDFNEPIITNKTFHTVGEDFWPITSTHQVLTEGVSIEVFPNPMTTSATFDLGDTEFQNGSLQVFDLTGKILRTNHFNQPNFMFNRNNLPAGAYFYLIKLDGQDAVSGKLMIGQ